MINQNVLEKVSGLDLIDEFIKYSARELGEIKVSEVISKVEKSNKVQKFLQSAKLINQNLGSDDFLACIHSSISFTFASPETIAIASIWLLNLWNQNIGIPNRISDDNYIKKRFITILEKCDNFKFHITSKENYFKRFFTQLERNMIKPIEDKNDPNFWVISAIEAVKHYKIGFERNNNVWDDFTFNCFLLNCGFIYLFKFPDEIEQIGWDYSIPEKNKFNDLIFQLANDFFKKKEIATGRVIEEKFENTDDVDSCIKWFAYYLKRFITRKDVEYMHLIVFNIQNKLISKEFNHVGHETTKNMHETVGFATKFGKASEFLGNRVI